MNKVQLSILKVVGLWIKTQTVPITLKEITSQLPDVNPRTVRASAESLCKKGYLRRGMNIKNNCCYICVRKLNNEE